MLSKKRHRPDPTGIKREPKKRGPPLRKKKTGIENAVPGQGEKTKL